MFTERVVTRRSTSKPRESDVRTHGLLRKYVATLATVYRSTCPSREPKAILERQSVMQYIENADLTARTGVYLANVLMTEAGLTPKPFLRTRQASWVDTVMMNVQHKVPNPPPLPRPTSMPPSPCVSDRICIPHRICISLSDPHVPPGSVYPARIRISLPDLHT